MAESANLYMKDNHTIGGDPGHLIRWTQIMREEIERKYG